MDGVAGLHLVIVLQLVDMEHKRTNGNVISHFLWEYIARVIMYKIRYVLKKVAMVCISSMQSPSIIKIQSARMIVSDLINDWHSFVERNASSKQHNCWRSRFKWFVGLRASFLQKEVWTNNKMQYLASISRHTIYNHC